jgi:hypothetical protein
MLYLVLRLRGRYHCSCPHASVIASNPTIGSSGEAYEQILEPAPNQRMYVSHVCDASTPLSYLPIFYIGYHHDQQQVSQLNGRSEIHMITPILKLIVRLRTWNRSLHYGIFLIDLIGTYLTLVIALYCWSEWMLFIK